MQFKHKTNIMADSSFGTDNLTYTFFLNCSIIWIQLFLVTSIHFFFFLFDLQHLLFPWIKKTRDSYHIISEILAHCQVYKFVSFRDIISFQLDWKMLTISNSVFEWLIGWQMWEQKKKRWFPACSYILLQTKKRWS